jgi:hypothetical protein
LAQNGNSVGNKGAAYPPKLFSRAASALLILR